MVAYSAASGDEKRFPDWEPPRRSKRLSPTEEYLRCRRNHATPAIRAQPHPSRQIHLLTFVKNICPLAPLQYIVAEDRKLSWFSTHYNNLAEYAANKKFYVLSESIVFTIFRRKTWSVTTGAMNGLGILFFVLLVKMPLRMNGCLITMKMTAGS